MSHRDDATDALSYLFQAMAERSSPMKAYWYHDGQTHEYEFTSLNNLVALDSPIPINAQVWVERSHDTWGAPTPLNPWYQVNARNRLVPVPIGVCCELRTALLVLGVAT